MTSRILYIIIFATVVMVITVAMASPQTPLRGNEIVERVGNVIPEDITYTLETGEDVSFHELLERPAVLSLVYYECPGICTPLLSGEIDVLNKLDLIPGQDYQAITLSFNELDSAGLAMEKKNNYFKSLSGNFPADAWRWLTGSNRHIKKLTRATGFNFIPSGQEFLHPAALIILSADGEIVRYLHGTSFSPFELKMALFDAGAIPSFGDRILRFVYQYDEATGEHVLSEARIFEIGAAAIILGIILGGVFIRIRKSRSEIKT